MGFFFFNAMRILIQLTSDFFFAFIFLVLLFSQDFLDGKTGYVLGKFSVTKPCSSFAKSKYRNYFFSRLFTK